MRTVALAALVASLAIVGCSRKQHLSKFHGQSYDAVFAAQRAPARAGPPQGPVEGLDSQEAAIISDSYRNSLARKTEKVDEQPLLLVAPPSRDRAAPALAPSVPKE